jgi:hypothetical protein
VIGIGAAGLLAGAGGSVRISLRVIAPTADELEAHQAYLAALDRESKGIGVS